MFTGFYRGFLICVLFAPKLQQLNHILKGTLSEILSALCQNELVWQCGRVGPFGS